MRKQVGWYNPKSGGLCMKHDKVPSPAYEMYTVPVFADDTVPMFTDLTPPMPECKKSRDENDKNDELMDAIQIQVLRNQHFLMGQLDHIRRSVEKPTCEFGPVTPGDDVMYKVLRKNTAELLNKEGCEP